MKQLYRATLTYEVFVVAEDEDQARDVFSSNASAEDLDMLGYSDGVIEEVKDAGAIPDNWKKVCPYGDASRSPRSCEDWMKDEGAE